MAASSDPDASRVRGPEDELQWPPKENADDILWLRDRPAHDGTEQPIKLVEPLRPGWAWRQAPALRPSSEAAAVSPTYERLDAPPLAEPPTLDFDIWPAIESPPKAAEPLRS